MKAYKLILINESKQIEFWKIRKNTKYLIGRNPEKSDIKISDSFVSRIHAEVYLNDENVLTIKDINSSNGTLIDGKKISPNVNSNLKVDNKVSFGDSKKYLLVKDYTREDTQTKEKSITKPRLKSPDRKIKSRSRDKVNLSNSKIFNNNSFYSKQNKRSHNYQIKNSPEKFTKHNNHHKNQNRHNKSRENHQRNNNQKNEEKIKPENKLYEYLKLKKEIKGSEENHEIKPNLSIEKLNLTKPINVKETVYRRDTNSEKEKQMIYFKEFEKLRNKSK